MYKCNTLTLFASTQTLLTIPSFRSHGPCQIFSGDDYQLVTPDVDYQSRTLDTDD